MTKNCLRLAAALFLVAAASRAEAIPVFARKYGMSCTACHVAWPILNAQGEHFRDNGYQFGLGKDDPVTLNPAYFPIAIRTTAAYQYAKSTNQAADDGSGTGATKPVTSSQGGVSWPNGLDILTAGSISQDLSFLVVVSGFGPDGTAAIESGWVRLNRLGGSSWANLRVGKFEPDQPASAHRNVTLTAGYAVYGALLPGSAVPFALDENQMGLELSGADARSATRYSLSLTSVSPGGEANQKGAWSTPLVYGHLQHAFETGSNVLPWVRIGALGALGSWPTKFELQPGGTGPLPGTGSGQKRFRRLGAELSAIFGNAATPLLLTAVFMNGSEDQGLASGTDPLDGYDFSTAKNSFNGGFLELDWVPWSEPSENALPWLFFARYDAVKYKHGPGDFGGFTIGARRYLAVGPRAAAAIHLEFHSDKVKRAGDFPGYVSMAGNAVQAGMDVQNTAFLAGIDFDF